MTIMSYEKRLNSVRKFENLRGEVWYEGPEKKMKLPEFNDRGCHKCTSNATHNYENCACECHGKDHVPVPDEAGRILNVRKE